MSKIRWGLLSTANINRRLIPAIRAASRGELVAVASRDKAKAEAYSAKWGIPRAFGDYQSMLDSGDIDAVYISLPNHLHAEWTVRSLQAGVHVLCEKPFAITLDEVDRMIAASRQTGCVLAEAFMYRHHPQTKIVGEWVRSGKLGEIRLVRGVFNFAMSKGDNIRLAPEYGGGCLWDVGVYPLSFAQFVYGGPPILVSGMQQLGKSGIDETFVGQMRYSGDRLAQITSSFVTPLYTLMEIIGEEGCLVLNKPFTGMDEERKLLFYPQQGDMQEIAVPEKELYLGEVEDMHAAILDGVPNYLSLQETRDHVRTTLGLYESARQAQYIELT
jgi:xylose dehydrogenase (NAD/NADP)